MFKKAINYLILFCTLFLLAPVCFASSSTYLFDKSNNPANNPRKIIVSGKPGDVITEHVTISNDLFPADFFIYGTDAKLTNEGKLTYKTYAQEQVETGTWISVKPNEFDLEPNEIVQTKIIISIPEEITNGTYKAGLGLQDSQKSQQGALVFNIRKIIEVEIEVSDNPKPIKLEYPKAMSFESFYFWGSVIVAAIFFLTLIAQLLSKRKRK